MLGHLTVCHRKIQVLLGCYDVSLQVVPKSLQYHSAFTTFWVQKANQGSHA